MASIIKENYLKALYFLDQKGDSISISDLGKEMNVSKPTVNGMVKKMEAMGWIQYEKYKPITLTSEGRKEAALVIRKHRLTEMFLVQIMGFGWEEVHDIAEEIEHVKSESFFDRMEEILGFPTRDPHGSPIPDKKGNTDTLNYQLLSKTEVGSKVIVRGLRDSSKEFLLYLNNKKIQLGTELKINSSEPFDKSINVTYGKTKDVVLSLSVSSRLLVEIK